MSTPTSGLEFGDLCKFWQWHGLFLGVVEPQEIDLSFGERGANGPYEVVIRFLLKGESMRRVSSLMYTDPPPELETSDFVFVKLFVDDDVKVLPRVEKRENWDCDDGLELVSPANWR